MGRSEIITIVGDRMNVLDDGRVEITLLIPLPLFRYKRWVKFYVHASELVIERDKITGVRCHPKLWEETLKSLAPELLEHFRKIVEKGTIKFREKVRNPVEFSNFPSFFYFACTHEFKPSSISRIDIPYARAGAYSIGNG